jgi:hypothetical protein
MGGGDVPGERSDDPQALLPLTPVALNVLLALADGERHGYGSCSRSGRGPAGGCGWGRARSTGRSNASRRAV